METAGFEKIGFHTALILNKLRTARQIADDGIACREVRSPRVFGSLEAPEINVAAVNTYGRDKSSVWTNTVSEPAIVSLIEGAGDLPQIRNSIVRSHTIDVIEFAIRPTAMNVQPSQTMAHEACAANANAHVPSLGLVTSSATDGNAESRPNLPCEDSGFMVVVEKFAKAISRKIGIEFVWHHSTEEHQKSEDQKRPADSNSGDRPEKQPDEQREYVQHRLRELAAWERRISGKKN